MTISRSDPSSIASVLFGLGLGALSVLLQRMLSPVFAPDSYQLLLSAVAISVMYTGVRAGLVALAVTALAKWFLFLPRESALRTTDLRALARFLLFLSLGVLICWLGQKLHASDRKLSVLSGLLPICAWCKRVRDEKDEWRQLEMYIHDHSEAAFTHSLCPDCERKLASSVKP